MQPISKMMMKRYCFILFLITFAACTYAQSVNDFRIEEITVVQRKKGKVKSRTEAFDTEKLNSEELCRAACCNLSEAFETNASVDVAYSDAATGAKQIRLLGLSGTYVQLIQENTPAVRGLAQNFGLEYIPGPWMSSIQVSKGTSSVVNGYEATTGQINVELLKPQTQNPFAVNLMINSELMTEANIMGGWEITGEKLKAKGDRVYTGILAHYGGSYLGMDENKDSFLDMPKVQNANLANRWVYRHGDYTFQAFVRGLYDRRRGGQIGHHSDTIANPYRINLNTWRVDGYIKNGYVYDPESGSSVAVITAVSYHDLDNSYGLRNWKANQLNAYLNAMWQGVFEGRGEVDNDHRLTAGLSVNYDRYKESLLLNSLTPLLLNRYEVTPGIFAEYNLKYDEMLSLVAGVRADYSTKHGFFFTPRMNIRYTPFEWWTLRGSVGMGYRSPNAIADNAFMLPSSRVLYLADVKQERAVNTGASTTFYIPMGSKQLQLSLEYYYTHFLNSLIVDMDQDKHAVYIYNQSDLAGAKSFAHCAQVEASIEVLRGWTWTAAFRWTDVKQTTIDANGHARLRTKALTNRFKGLITTSYQTPLKKWQFDVTAQFNGVSRVPDGFEQPFTWYPQLMAQITKYFRTCSIYLGAENMTNFRQDPSIVDSFHPYGADFDASMVCGPTTGWKIYLGFRYDLEKKDDL